MKRVASRANADYKALVALAGSTREQRAAGIALLDGPHLVEAMMTAGLGARWLVATDNALRDAAVAALFERCRASERMIVADRLFDALSPLATPVGIIAFASIVDPGPLPEPLGDAVVLDRLQDPGNVGSILRSAAAAGIRRVLATTASAYLWSAKVLRAAQGAHFFLALHEGVTIDALTAAMRGSRAIATRLDAPLDLYDADLRGPTVWLFGNEGGGVDPMLARHAALAVRIPMSPATESLNVGAAAAVCLFEQRRQRAVRAAG